MWIPWSNFQIILARFLNILKIILLWSSKEACSLRTFNLNLRCLKTHEYFYFSQLFLNFTISTFVWNWCFRALRFRSYCLLAALSNSKRTRLRYRWNRWMTGCWFLHWTSGWWTLDLQFRIWNRSRETSLWFLLLLYWLLYAYAWVRNWINDFVFN